jgi:hypothetical protein
VLGCPESKLTGGEDSGSLHGSRCKEHGITAVKYDENSRTSGERAAGVKEGREGRELGTTTNNGLGDASEHP